MAVCVCEGSWRISLSSLHYQSSTSVASVLRDGLGFSHSLSQSSCKLVGLAVTGPSTPPTIPATKNPTYTSANSPYVKRIQSASLIEIAKGNIKYIHELLKLQVFGMWESNTKGTFKEHSHTLIIFVYFFIVELL